MNRFKPTLTKISSLSFSIALCLGVPGVANATKPCEDFGECKALIEINASDGDVGFHFLMDGDSLNSARIFDPNGKKIFEDMAKGPLREQKLTETFVESAEPLCWLDPERDDDELIVFLDEFLDRWTPGSYLYTGSSDGGEKSFGETELTFELPAAPADVDFDGSAISWNAGVDLGECASADELDDMVAADILPTHPEDVEVSAWEVVLEPDVEDDDPVNGLKFSIRVPGNVFLPASVTVPSEYLLSLPENTPLKAEVGAIGVDDNATFSEVDDFCNTADGECPDEEEEEE